MIAKTLGLIGLGTSLAVIFLFEGTAAHSHAFRMFHWPALVLTGLGPLSLIFICFDWKTIGLCLYTLFGNSPNTRMNRLESETRTLDKLGKDFYEHGVDAFEKVRTRHLAPYLRKMIDRLTVRVPSKDVRELLEHERDRFRIRMIQCLNVTALGVRVAPSMGMLGTILGMVRLLSTLQDPSQIGGHMSTALLTTFYGLFFSLIVWTPVQQKIDRVLDIELESFDQAIDWLNLLERRKPADYFAEMTELHPVETTRKSAS